MKNSTFSKPKLKIDDHYDPTHLLAIQELLDHPDVQSMEEYIHHGSITCFEHNLSVSYYSYRLASRWNLDNHAVARGALLHDFYLYDWHKKENRKGLHGFTHASSSLANAQLRFSLTPIEKDIILKHMWPMQPRFPRYKESFLVCFVDKMISLMETAHLIHFKPIQWIFPTMMIIYPR
jgi:uncharacterized protein